MSLLLNNENVVVDANEIATLSLPMDTLSSILMAGVIDTANLGVNQSKFMAVKIETWLYEMVDNTFVFLDEIMENEKFRQAPQHAWLRNSTDWPTPNALKRDQVMQGTVSQVSTALYITGQTVKQALLFLKWDLEDENQSSLYEALRVLNLSVRQSTTRLSEEVTGEFIRIAYSDLVRRCLPLSPNDTVDWVVMSLEDFGDSGEVYTLHSWNQALLSILDVLSKRQDVVMEVKELNKGK